MYITGMNEHCVNKNTLEGHSLINKYLKTNNS